MVSALKKFWVYLLGLTFKIATDCAAFKGTMERKELTSRIAGWALQLQEFNYVLEHRPSSRMRHVDALFRGPMLVMITNNVTNKVKAAQKEDDLKTIFQLLESGEYDDYITTNGVLFRVVKGTHLLVFPRSMQNEVIRACHKQGHFGATKTEELVTREFFIHNLRGKVANYIKNCIRCILVNRKDGKKDDCSTRFQRAIILL